MSDNSPNSKIIRVGDLTNQENKQIVPGDDISIMKRIIKEQERQGNFWSSVMMNVKTLGQHMDIISKGMTETQKLALTLFCIVVEYANITENDFKTQYLRLCGEEPSQELLNLLFYNAVGEQKEDNNEQNN